MKLIRKSRGAISIFLVIILVPIITVTSLFVDASRMYLSKTVIDSAGDLAMNTALAQYDAQLNDYYGLMASAQSIPDFKQKVEGYLEKSINSQSVNNDYYSSVVNQIKDAFDMDANGESAISDLLDISLDKESFSIAPISNSGLDNPAVLKTQIVDFMKYRAPINTIAELFDNLKKVSKASENKKEEAELLDKKNTMAIAEGNLMDTLLELYQNSKSYMDIASKNGYNNMSAFFKTWIKELEKFEKKYKEVHDCVACNVLYITDLSKNVKKFIPEDEEIDWKYKEGHTKGIAEEECYFELEDLVEQYEDAKKNIQGIMDELLRRDKISKSIHYINYGERIYPAYCGDKSKQITGYKEIVEKIDLYVYCLEKLDKKDATIYKKAKRIINEVNGNYSLYTKLRKNENGKYSVSKDIIQKMVEEEKKKAESLLLQIYNQATLFESYIKMIETDTQKAINKIHSCLSGKKLECFEISVADYKDSAIELKNKGSDLGKQEVENLNNTKKSKEDEGDGYQINLIQKNVTEDTLYDMKQRLINIRTNVDRLKEGLHKIKYGDTKIKDINDVDTITKILKDSGLISKELIREGDTQKIQSASNAAFIDLYHPFPESAGDTSWISKNESMPDLNQPGNQNKYSRLYCFLEEKFKEMNIEDDANKKAEYKSYKNKKDEIIAEDEKKVDSQYKTSKNEIANNTSVGLPSKSIDTVENEVQGFDEGQSKKDVTMGTASDNLQNMFAALGDKLKGARDDFYTLDYVMHMFTHDVTAKEAMYDIARENGKDVATLEKTIASQKDSDIISQFEDTKITNSYNHTMTNKLLSTENNYSYGNEIEYIIFGKTNASNKAKSWGTIYAIRFALNSVYCFKEFYKDKTISLTAASISAATCGVVPVTLVKIAILLALVATESLNDLAMMKTGMPVALFKSKESWVCSLEGIIDNVKDDLSKGESEEKEESKIQFRYSDYLKIFFMVAIMGANEDKIYGRIADVIQCNMQLHESGFSMNKAKTWYTIKANFTISPLMLNMPINNNSSWDSNVKMGWNQYKYQFSNGYY